MKPRLIVVDPSLTSHEGDRWQYAVELANTAFGSGYDFILLTHNNSPDISRELKFKINQIRVFDHAFYEHDRIYSRHRTEWEPVERRRANRRLRERVDELQNRRDNAAYRGDLIAVDAIDRRIARAKTAAAFRDRLKRWFAPRKPGDTPFNRDDFGTLLARELDKLQPGPQDRLFFHTMTYGMMESLAEVTVVRDHRAPYDTNAYFLFHFGADASDARTFLDRYHSYSAYGSIASRLKVGSPFARMYFLATSPALQEEAAQIIGAPVGFWPGLVNAQHLHNALGSEAVIARRRAEAARAMTKGNIRIVARAADLDAGKARAVARACHLIQHRGSIVDLRILFHAGVKSRLREIFSNLDFPNVTFVDTNDNEAYIGEICDAGMVILAYDQEKYEKRVSAVLHDCAVLGVPMLVPARTTLADCDFGHRFIYGSNEDMLGAALNAVRFLQRNPSAPLARTESATKALASNSITRLIESMPQPSLTRSGSAPIANVIMPLWGRVGSSFAIEGQIRYLIERGYFVNQILIADKPVELPTAIEWFWKMLAENSRHCRGVVQRIAFLDSEHGMNGRDSEDYLAGNAFDQFLRRIARGSCHDEKFARQMRQASLTVVNHVFNADWALAHCGGQTILETHDIQSYQMANWPLINDANGMAESIRPMLASELKAVAKFDHVINVAPEEHVILSLANPHSSLVTPYIPFAVPKGRYSRVADMAAELNWHESYQDVDRFDLLIAGDSHPANREAVVWFIREVFEPFLAPHGISLAIAGRLADAIHDTVGPIAYVFYIGFVADLDSVKALSSIAILPDRRGTGISIKTLEAFATGMAFVGTSIAFRGIRDRLPSDCLGHDNANDFAQAVVQMLASPANLRASRQLARRCYDAVTSREQFDRAWDGILEKVMNPAKAQIKDNESTVKEIQPEPRSAELGNA